MKKVFSAFFIMIIVAVALGSLFAIGTRRGYFAVDAYINGSSGSPAYEKSASEGDAFVEAIKKELRHSEKIDIIPDDDYVKLKVYVKYFPDITMSYPIYLNPYEGKGFIDKGFFAPRYNSLSRDTVQLLCSSDDTKVHMENGDSFPLSREEFQVLMDSINTVATPTVHAQDMINCRIESILSSGLTLDFELGIIPVNNEIYVIVQDDTYSVDSQFSTVFLSKDPIFDAYLKGTRPVPDFALTSTSTLIASEVSGKWTFVKPSGEMQAQTISNEVGSPSSIIEPGVSLSYETESGRLPDSLTLREIINGSETAKIDLLKTTCTVPRSEGSVHYVLEAVYDASDDFPDYGTITKKYLFEVNLPSESRMVYSEVKPGDVLAFFVDFADEGESFEIKTNLGGFTGDFSPYKDKMIVYVPVNWWTRPGEYYARIYKSINGSRELMDEYPVTVLPDNFETTNQQLVVSEELAQKASADASAYDSARVSAAKASTNPTSYLEGPFIMPLNGALGTSFGRTRYINWKNPYRHSGLDIDGETGDPIIAGNNGKIVLAEELIRCGNTVIIDHGMGLFTSYLHMSEIDVSIGDFVEKGDLLGKVGSTGFSTGSHLHWAATLGGNYISPLWLVNNPLVPE